MDLTEKTNKLTEAMKKFSDDINNHQNTFNGITTTMISAIEKLNEEVKTIVMKNDELNGERNTIKDNNETVSNNIQRLNTEKEGLEVKINNYNDEIQQIKPEVENLKNEIISLTYKIEENKSKLTNLKGVLQSKTAMRETTEANAQAQIDAKQMELDTAKTKSQDIIENNIIWDYLKSKIDNPEIDILAVIAGTRNITSAEIKKRASSISAVLITRSISKLENDGKIVSMDGKWDLSPPLLAELEKQ
ncbi:MAG: hypothetical protein ACW99A_14165 [Candidatus Kariarchaeaceae archaeon]|jgi:chromosome segregation ATPase